MGRSPKRPGARDVHGILLLDKPVGLSSNQALQTARRLLNARKAGHTGSLDPMACGLLPLCFGEATKLSGYLLDSDKRYEARVLFGTTTTTGDAEGEVLEQRDAAGLDEGSVRTAMAALTGPIEQVPPMYSALKQGGRPLYELARKGQTVERDARPVTIHAFELLAFEGAEATVSVHCSKGTYIRTLAEDLGEALGVGAHLTALRRTGAGPFTLAGTVTLADFEALSEPARDARLTPMDEALVEVDAVELSAEASGALCHGQTVALPDLAVQGLVRVYGPARRFLGLGTASADGLLAPRRLIQTQTLTDAP